MLGGKQSVWWAGNLELVWTCVEWTERWWHQLNWVQGWRHYVCTYSRHLWERCWSDADSDTDVIMPFGWVTWFDVLECVTGPALGSLTAAWVIYCMTNFTGSTSPTGCFSSWQWQFTGVLTAAHHRTCPTTAFRPPVSTLGGICVPPTVKCLQYLVTGSTLTAVRPFQLPAQNSGTLSRISSRTRPSVQAVSDVCLKRTCSLNTSAFSTIEVFDDNRAL